MNPAQPVICLCAGAVGFALMLLLVHRRITLARYLACTAATMAAVWWAYVAYFPLEGREGWFTGLLYAPVVTACAAASVMVWRRANRPGWYGGRHERIDNP